MPQLAPDEFVVTSPEVSGPGGMTVPAELGEIISLNVQEGEQVSCQKHSCPQHTTHAEVLVLAEMHLCAAH